MVKYALLLGLFDLVLVVFVGSERSVVLVGVLSIVRLSVKIKASIFVCNIIKNYSDKIRVMERGAKRHAKCG